MKNVLESLYEAKAKLMGLKAEIVSEEPSYARAIGHINKLIRKYKPTELDLELDTNMRERINKDI